MGRVLRGADEGSFIPARVGENTRDRYCAEFSLFLYEGGLSLIRKAAYGLGLLLGAAVPEQLIDFTYGEVGKPFWGLAVPYLTSYV